MSEGLISGLDLAIRLGLAGVFVVAALAKLADLAGTRSALREFGTPDPLARPAAWALVLSELAIAALLIPATTARGAAIAAAALLIVFSAALARNLDADCNCFGALAGTDARRALVRNAVLVTAALAVAGGTSWSLAIAAALLAAGLGWVGWRRVRRDDEPPEKEQVFRVPPIGAPAPRFALRDPAGAWHTLDDLLVEANPVLLVFSDPDCDACASLPTTLARLTAGRDGELEAALVTRGAAEEGSFAPVLVQQHHEVARAYGVDHVPSALIVDGEGRIASALALGEHAIERLAVA